MRQQHGHKESCAWNETQMISFPPVPRQSLWVTSPPMTSGWGSSDPPKPQSPGTEFGALSHLPTLTNSATPPRGGVNGRKMNLFCLVLAKIVFDLGPRKKTYEARHGMWNTQHAMPGTSAQSQQQIVKAIHKHEIYDKWRWAMYCTNWSLTLQSKILRPRGKGRKLACTNMKTQWCWGCGCCRICCRWRHADGERDFS